MFAAFVGVAAAALAAGVPDVPPWPDQFHAVLLQNRSGSLALVDLYYDWTNGRNYNIIRPQQDPTATLYDLEYMNGTTKYYTPGKKKCFAIDMHFGLLRPDWMHGAKYLGRQMLDGFETDVFNQSAMGNGTYFATYFNNVATQRPVAWRFFDGAWFHVMSFEPGVPSKPIEVPIACPFVNTSAASALRRW